MSVITDSAGAGILACPSTGIALELVDRTTAERALDCDLVPLRRSGRTTAPPAGVTGSVLLRQDRAAAYPVLDGVPVLLAPEVLGAPSGSLDVDLADPRYAEAYEEMTFYNEVATREAENMAGSPAHEAVRAIMATPPEERRSFPEPRSVWLDATYDCAAQWDAYRHVAPVEGKKILQLGGKGIHAVKFLLGGAAEAWVVTPMLGEIRCAAALARLCGVEDRMRYALAVAEELPFADASFDAAYSGGCVHHMVTSLAFPEIARVLRDGGRFGALDPWRAPLYAIGTRIFGKREPGVHCRPLTRERIDPMARTFRSSRVELHGALTRYPLLALQKLGLPSRLETVWRLNRLDDGLCSLIPGFRRLGSSASLRATK